MEMGYKNKLESPSGVIVAAQSRGNPTTNNNSNTNTNTPNSTNPNSKTSKDARLFRQRANGDFEIWRVMPDRPSSLTFMTQGPPVVVEGLRPRSEMEAGVERPKPRVPILGPTRQQTELYLKKRARRMTRHNVVPMDGPATDIAVGTRLQELAVFDDKAANDVLAEAESQLRSGYPTIAASTVVNRNPPPDDGDESSHTAIKFFSELVKPVKYRWKFQKDPLKTISPSKQGFHPRSQSPTFQRLVEANEKLHGIMKQRKSGARRYNADNDESKSEIAESCDKPPAILRYVRSEAQTHRVGELPTGLEAVTPKFYERVHFKPDVRTIEPHKVDAVCFDDDGDEEDDDDDDYKSPANTPPKQHTTNTSNSIGKISEFKVDFKKMDSHSELHLFLPQIDDAHSRLATPENKRSRNNINKLGLALPNIATSKDISESRRRDEDEERLRQRRTQQKSEFKKKKKKMVRIKSGNEEKEIRDRLNDVPTLISLENERPEADAESELHSTSTCVFENCSQHPPFRKSTKIRQA